MNTPVTLAGIPGTLSPEAARIRWIRGSDDVTTGARFYRAVVADGTLLALVSQDEVREGVRLWHVSVSHRFELGQNVGRMPVWDEVKHAAYRLIPEDVPLVLVFPRRSSAGTPGYVNVQDNCLHVYESEDKEIDR